MPKGQSYLYRNVLFVNCEKCNTSRSFSCEKDYKSYLKRHAKVCDAICMPASANSTAFLPNQSTIVTLDF